MPAQLGRKASCCGAQPRISLREPWLPPQPSSGAGFLPSSLSGTTHVSSKYNRVSFSNENPRGKRSSVITGPFHHPSQTPRKTSGLAQYSTKTLSPSARSSPIPRYFSVISPACWPSATQLCPPLTLGSWANQNPLSSYIGCVIPDYVARRCHALVACSQGLAAAWHRPYF